MSGFQLLNFSLKIPISPLWLCSTSFRAGKLPDKCGPRCLIRFATRYFPSWTLTLALTISKKAARENNGRYRIVEVKRFAAVHQRVFGLTQAIWQTGIADSQPCGKRR